MFGVHFMKKERIYNFKSISYWRLIIAVFVLITLLVSAFAEFYYKETAISDANSQTVLKEYAVNSTKSTQININNALDYIIYQSNVFSEFDDIHSPEALSMLAKLKNKNIFTVMRLTTPDGSSRDYINTEINISEREYFKDAMSGNPVISDRIISKSSGKEIIVACAPIYKAGKIIGTLHGVIDIAILSDFIDNSCFNGNSHTAIITAKGEKIYLSEADDFGETNSNFNFINYMKTAEFNDETTYSSFIYSITNDQSALLKYSVDGESYVTYITPVKINNWFFVQTIPEKAFSLNSKNTIRNVLWLLVEDAFVISFFLIIIYILINKNIKAARNTAKRTSMLVNSLSCGVVEFRVGDDYFVEYVSDSMFSLFGYSKAADDTHEDSFKRYLSNIISAEDCKKLEKAIADTIEYNESIHLECRATIKGKESLWIAIDGGLIEKNLKTGSILQLTFIDITDLKNTVFSIDKDRTRYLKLLSINNDFCFEYYFEKDLIYFSDNALKILDCPYEIKDFSVYIKDKDKITAENVRQCGIFSKETFASEKSSTSKLRLLCKDGTYHWFKIDLTPINDASGKKNSIIGRATDITNEKVETDSIIEASRTDLMTGLLNKVTVEDEIRKDMKLSDEDRLNALIIIDIDDFKNINDTFGHSVGDEVIKEVGDLLKDNFRSSDILGRIGGDEFVIYMRKIFDRDMLEEKIQMLLHDVLSLKVEAGCEISCSAGIILLTKSKDADYKELFELADKNLYNSKLRGKNCYTISDWGGTL